MTTNPLNTSQSTVLIVGGPDAGKTNYIGQFWLAVEHGHSLLSTNGPPNDLTYFSDVCDKILQGEFAPRTNYDTAAIAEIPLKVTSDQRFGVLRLPDRSGEIWLKKVSQLREWPKDWDEYLDEMAGLLLFIRVASDQIQLSCDWVSVQNILREYVGDTTPKKLPTEVLLVDWIQIITSRFASRVQESRKLKIGVVITAWDRVPPEQRNADPRKWLRSNFPMFDQFIDTCSDRYEFAVFGVSAIGGDFAVQPEYAATFLARSPQNCGYTVYVMGDEVKEQPDVTLPIAWCLGVQLP